LANTSNEARARPNQPSGFLSLQLVLVSFLRQIVAKRLFGDIRFGMDFWDRLDWLIKERGMTRREVTQRLGLGVSAVSVWKTRRTYPDADVAVGLARTLGVTVEYLVEGPSAKSDATPAASDLVWQIAIPRERHELLALVEKLTTLDATQLKQVSQVVDILVPDPSPTESRATE
jgi:transcriptional regulator with XRE-family HTH domain